VIAHAAKQRRDGRVPVHSTIGKMLLDRQHQRGVEKLRKTAAVAQQPCEHRELPFTARSIEKRFGSRPE
jgi:hypothetical protein